MRYDLDTLKAIFTLLVILYAAITRADGPCGPSMACPAGKVCAGYIGPETIVRPNGQRVQYPEALGNCLTEDMAKYYDAVEERDKREAKEVEDILSNFSFCSK